MEIITTGEEVLAGEILDGNAAWLSQQLHDHGLPLHRRTTVGDRMDDLVAALREAACRNRLVLVNGGLGPTEDDLTAEAAARAAGVDRRLQQDWLHALEQRLQRQGGGLSRAHRRQALLPAGAETIPNPTGSACGFWLKIRQAWFCFTPGPPRELQPMFSRHILPRLLERFGDGQRNLLSRVHLFGLGESMVARRLETLRCPAGTRLGYRPHLPAVEIKVISRGRGEELAEQHARVRQAVRQALGDFIYAEDDQNLPETLHRLMLEKGHSLALAESCTAGLVAARLAEQAGCSAWLRQGWVVYSAEAKQSQLGVSAALIRREGVISQPVAETMAQGARARAGTSLALAITGQAGPVDGDEPVPAGTACVALAHAGGVVSAGWQHRDFGRNDNREVQAWLLLDLLRRYLLGLPTVPEYGLARPWKR